MARKTKYSWAGLVLMLLVSSLCKVTAAGSRLRIGADGGYSDVLVKISANTDQKYCRRILSNLQVIQSVPTLSYPLFFLSTCFYFYKQIIFYRLLNILCSNYKEIIKT